MSVATIEILDRGTIDDRDSAFPQATQLPNGDILCSYSNAGRDHVTGGTDWARSTDGGRTWTVEGTLLPPVSDPPSQNFLKLSCSPDGRTIYAYGERKMGAPGQEFGHRPGEALLCRSTDGGHTWSGPQVIPMPSDRLEISHGILPLRSGRLLAPTATIEPGHLGERVVVAVSDDGGATWPRHATALQDPDGQLGYFEQKLAELPDGRIIASAWTVTLADVADRPNSYALSSDGGLTWSAPRFIGTPGQTLSVVPLGGDRAMLLYNRRYGEQGIVMALARMTEENWPIEFEALLYDARARRDTRVRAGGVEEMQDFAFGFPTAARLADGTFLATHWSVDDGRCGVRWVRLRVVA